MSEERSTSGRERQSDDAVRFKRGAEQPPESFVHELVLFLRTNKRWWLAPIVLALLALAGLVVLAGSPAAPFIYPFF